MRTSTAMIRVTAPASSANLGPGFDCLGLALDLPLTVTAGGDGPTDEHHPAVKAFRHGGGTGPLQVESVIPAGKGLGFSGAARVAGLMAAAAQQGEQPVAANALPRFLAAATELDGHPDNVAATLLGGLVAVAGSQAVRVPMAVDGIVVVWTPPGDTSTRASRKGLVGDVSRDDAVFNVGRASLLVAAVAAGDHEALREATEDRLHQDRRLDAVPESRRTLECALDAGAWGAWLSGSGPTIAAWCPGDAAAHIAAQLPDTGLTRLLPIASEGARIID